MSKVKFDGLIEAVRYRPDGRVEWVRAYLRRGATFSDHILLNRQSLVEMLKGGKRFMTGKRVQYNASTFDVADPVQIIETNGRTVILAGGGSKEQDNLAGVPVV